MVDLSPRRRVRFVANQEMWETVQTGRAVDFNVANLFVALVFNVKADNIF